MCKQSKIFYEPEIFMSLEFKILGKNIWKHSDLLGLTQVPQQPPRPRWTWAILL